MTPTRRLNGFARTGIYWVLAVVVAAVWTLGTLTGNDGAGLIHVLLVVEVLIVFQLMLRLIQGRKPI